MIDWVSVIFGALWILGLSLVAASLSFEAYFAALKARQPGHVQFRSASRIAIDLGLVFFCLGLIYSTAGLWGRLVWAFLALLFVVRVWLDGKSKDGRN